MPELRAGIIAPPLKARPLPFRIAERLPTMLRFAIGILILFTAVGFVSYVVRLFHFDWNTYVATSHATETREHRAPIPESFLLEGLIFSWIATPLLLASRVVLAYLIRRGRNWVRILFTGVEVVGLISTFMVAPDLLSYLNTAADIAFVALLWVPPSNRYFLAVKTARALHRSRQLSLTHG
jgi:hypothetical protein